MPRTARTWLRRVSALLGGLLALVAAADPAWAGCAGTYTYVHTGSGGSSYTLNAGQSLRIQSGTYTATINTLAATATICIDSGATMTPAQVNSATGKIFNYGTVNFPGFNPDAGFELDNFGKAVFVSNVNFNGATTLRNRANATLIFRTAVQIGNGTSLLNDGFVIADFDFNTASGTVFTNNFEVLTKGTFNPTGTVNNYGRVHAEAFININGGSAATNYCSWIADQGFNNNSNSTINLGLIFINWSGSGSNNLWQNNANFQMGPNAIVYGWRFFNQSTITNTTSAGGSRFYFKTPSGLPGPAEHTKNQGPFIGTSASNRIIFYDESQTGSQIFDTQNVAPVNTVRTAFTAPPIDYAAPTCSPAIRQVMYDPNPPSVTYDFSDAPASYGAPSHQIVAGYRLGTTAPDWDGGGYATPNADGDDLSGADDENGVTLPTISKGSPATLNVTVAGTNGRLQAWIDYNGDGDFADAGEQIATNRQDNGTGGDAVAGNGIINLTFTPPAAAAATKTFLRLRWSSTAGVNATSASVANGEVEDYSFTFGLAPEPEAPPGGGSTPSSCAPGAQLIVQPGNAASQTSSGTVANPANAVGPVSPNGSFASASNSANLGTGGILTLDLTGASGQPIATGADITISIGRDSTDGRMLVETSLNAASWTTIGSYGAGGTLGNDFVDDVLKHMLFEAPAGGMRYVRFTRQAGNMWVDGAAFADICGMPATLTVVKSSVPYTPGGYMVPGGDVSYDISVSNSGTGAIDASTILVVDKLPTTLTFYNGDYDGAGPQTNPVVFLQTGAGLAFNYATDVRYSNAATAPASFAACTFTPPAGYAAAVRFICVRPSGTMAGSGSGTSFTLRFRARIN